MREDAPSQTPKVPNAGVPNVAAGGNVTNHPGSCLSPMQPSIGASKEAAHPPKGIGPRTAPDPGAPTSAPPPTSPVKGLSAAPPQPVISSEAAGAARTNFSVPTGEPSKPSPVVSGTEAAPAGPPSSHPAVAKAEEVKSRGADRAEYLYLQVAAQKQQRCTPIDRTDSRPPGEFIRRNGFTQPFQIYQVASWVLFALDIVMFYLVVVPAVSVPVKAVFGILFGVSAIVLFVTACRCTSADPIDPLAFASGPWAAPVEGETPEERQERIETEPAEATRSCTVCGGVRERSKHCRSCNKCVDVFDHHCIWINNCVGKANYREFVGMLTAAAVMVLMVIALCLYQIIAEAVTGASGPHWQQAYRWFDPVGFYIISAIPILVNVPILGLVVQLLLLHIYLIYHHMTTFDYITMRVEEEVEKKSPRVRYRACTEWIVIDKKRLRRARRKASFTGHASDMSQCAPVNGPSLSIELQTPKAAAEKKAHANLGTAEAKERPPASAEAEALIGKV